MPRALVVGGTSGLGLDLAKRLAKVNDEVVITGREKPGKSHMAKMRFFHLELSSDKALRSALVRMRVQDLGRFDTIVYSAGFSQTGKLYHLSTPEISWMINVGLFAPAFLIRNHISAYGSLSKLILITSTSQWKARVDEPVYCATKAGLGMLGECLGKDEAIGKVLVAAPAGMQSNFRRKEPEKGEDLKFLKTSWVADMIMGSMEDTFKYRFMKILRNPPRVEVVETVAK